MDSTAEIQDKPKPTDPGDLFVAQWDSSIIMAKLRDPLDGSRLRFETIVDGGTGLLMGETHTWPVVDGVAMLRAGRDALREAVCSKIRQVDRSGALRLLLNDRDDFDTQPSALVANIDAVIESASAPGCLSAELLYTSMRRLNFGPVADYFAVRPSTPTFISGLALFAQTAGGCDLLIDVGCGIGQLCGWIQRQVNIPIVAIDTVFSKLWLARHSYLPDAPLICADICRGRLPLTSTPTQRIAVMCHDAFYFFQDKRSVLVKAKQLAGPKGIILLGHVHTDRDPHQVGYPQPIAAYEKLFHELLDVPWTVVDDERLAQAALNQEPIPFQTGFDGLQHSAAISVCIGHPQPLALDLQVLPGEPYAPNPALVFEGDSVQVRWPSASLANEYTQANYLCDVKVVQLAPAERRRRRIDLPADFVIPTDLDAAITAVEAPVCWAMVGCGWVARDYGVPALLNAPNAALTVCIDADAGALANMRQRLPEDVQPSVLFAHAITPEALANADAVYVATPNHSHAAVVAELAALKKHVLCEKPMTTTVADAEALITAVEKHGVHYATALDQRHHPAHVKLRHLIEDGCIGKVTQVRIHYACWLPMDWSPDQISRDNWRVDFARSGGGAVIDLASHGIDLIEFLTGDRADWINVRLQKCVHDYAICDDGGVVLVQTRSGVLGSLHLSYACPDALPRRRLEVIGSRGMLQATNTMGQTAGGTLTLIDHEARQSPMAFDDEDVTPFQRQMEAFSAVVLNRREPWNSPRSELRTHTLFLDALQKAAAHLVSPAAGDTLCP